MAFSNSIINHFYYVNCLMWVFYILLTRMLSSSTTAHILFCAYTFFLEIYGLLVLHIYSRFCLTNLSYGLNPRLPSACNNFLSIWKTHLCVDLQNLEFLKFQFFDLELDIFPWRFFSKVSPHKIENLGCFIVPSKRYSPLKNLT